MMVAAIIDSVPNDEMQEERDKSVFGVYFNEVNQGGKPASGDLQLVYQGRDSRRSALATLL